MNEKTLIVLVGPTGVGKTDLSIQLAEYFACPIISSDSRQIYKELKIGSAPPNESQLERVKHYFIGIKSMCDSYNAGQYELDVMELLEEHFKKNNVALLVGGSMMYIDAVCKGLDNIPAISAEIRNKVTFLYENIGLEGVRAELLKLDPIHYQKVDLNNKQRVMHALEVCLTIGGPYSEILRAQHKRRNFNIIKIGINLPREQLYKRINSRVDLMIDKGLIEEAKALYPYKQYNSLNTVGYKEFFEYFEGKCTLDFAIQMVKQDSRRYAKRQLTWFNADKEIQWFSVDQFDEILDFLKGKLLN